MLDYLRRKKLFNNFVKKIKGSLRTPCLCMAVIAVFLFVFISLTSGSFFKSLTIDNDFVFFLEESKKSDLFVVSAKNFSLESPELLLIENTSLKASSSPNTLSPQTLGTLVADYYEEENSKMVITEYFVESGDTLSSLAEKFNISLKTILWANNLNEKSIIRPGDKLVIPPVSGVLHLIKSGDTLSQIAKIYKGKVDEITAFNNLLDENDIYIGDILIIPGGIMPAESQQAPANVTSIEGKFIVPVSSPYIITQGGHGYYDRYYGYVAIDFSHTGYACGKPVFAAAGGTIQKTGYDSIAGYYVRILHPNGVVTFYGHLSSVNVKRGEAVSVGDIIGYMGNTGYTIGKTGCHLHFEVRGAKNPFIK